MRDEICCVNSKDNPVHSHNPVQMQVEQLRACVGVRAGLEVWVTGAKKFEARFCPYIGEF